MRQKIETKQCRQCGKIKPIDEFYKKSNGQVFGRCKECAKTARVKNALTESQAYHSRYYQENKERLNKARKNKRDLERKRNGYKNHILALSEITEMIDMYRHGIPCKVIAQRLGASYSNVMRYINDYKNSLSVNAKAEKTCKDCARYPCFKGIDTMSSNLALTCHDFNQIIN